jgi:hypothetical protein
MKVTHHSGYEYESQHRDEFFDTFNRFASDLLRAHRTNTKVPRPAYVKNPTKSHMFYSRLWKDYYAGLVTYEYTIDEDSLTLIQPPVASKESLNRLLTREV